ncbi:MAG: polymer-forming cytoskeletal protein [Sulfuritalea sp.]|jgi:cytoskeletal protein CcmA (bactofilin family)|nr:polymer-forming cytoskeletal protein [Sulfuritalea sp.]MDP1985601.1 polymer-forming cytoskeletal protein [Sulfuritalea sp.]
MLTKSNLFSKREDNVATRDPRLAGYGQNTGGASTRPANSVSGTPVPPGSSASSPNAGNPAAATPTEPAVITAKSTEGIAANRLVVGPEVKLKGAEILDCDTLIVEGRVEATMDSRVINIAGNGSFSGKVGIDVAEIHGRFDGELTARSQLIIHATGRVSGTIRYGKILIEEGGEVSGDVRSLASAEAPPTLSHRVAAIDFPKAVPAAAVSAS